MGLMKKRLARSHAYLVAFVGLLALSSACGGDSGGSSGDGDSGDGDTAAGDGDFAPGDGDFAPGDGDGDDGPPVTFENPLTDPTTGPAAGYAEGGCDVPEAAGPEDSSNPTTVVGDGIRADSVPR